MKRTATAKIGHSFGDFRLRHDLHLMRKAWHMGMGLMMAYLYMNIVSYNTALLLLGFFLGLDVVMETLRLKNPTLNEKIMRYLGVFMRSHEVHQMSTIPHYLSSVFLAIAIFPKPIAILSILYLACGDPMASTVGILYGNHGPRLKCGKTLIGSAAGFATCALITMAYLTTLSLPPDAVLIFAIVGGFAGGFAELLPFDIDDNFIIPIISGFVLWLAFLIMGF